MPDIKFYKCGSCSKIVELYTLDKKCPTVCCGKDMVELVPNTTDAATEKHVPDVTVEGNVVKIQVGSTIHPMTQDHYIEFIILLTDKNVYRKNLTPSDEPKACFTLNEGEKPLKAYEYCNLHGLWLKEL